MSQVDLHGLDYARIWAIWSVFKLSSLHFQPDDPTANDGELEEEEDGHDVNDDNDDDGGIVAVNDDDDQDGDGENDDDDVFNEVRNIIRVLHYRAIFYS